MMAEVLRDLKAELREFPEFAAVLVLAVIVGIGFNTAVFCNAIGNELQIHATQGQSAMEQMEMLRMRSCSEELKPGFTVIVELRKYSVELSVPLDGVRSLFNDIRANIAGSSHRDEHAA